MSFIKDMIESPHPVYQQNRWFWDFLLDSYEGGLAYTNAGLTDTKSSPSALKVKVNGKEVQDKRSGSHLFQHKKEITEDFIQRIDMSYYYNFCAPIIDIYSNHLFKQPIIEDWGSIEATITRKENNIDRKDGSIKEFRKELNELVQIYGHTFVLVDSPRSQRQIFSEQDRIDQDAFPYLTIFHPQNVINWSLDRFGHPYWVLVRETMDGNADPSTFKTENRTDVQFRLWEREQWSLYDSVFNLIDMSPHGLNKVPLVCVVNKPSKKVRNFLGISEITDISLIARDVYNLCSELREIIRNQTFAILAIQGTTTDYDKLSVGTSKALLYPEGTNQPVYVSPPGENEEVIKDQIDKQIAKMFQLAKLEGGSVHQNQSAIEQSGASKAWDFNETNSALSKKAEHMMDGEMKIWECFANWEDKEFDGTITYAKEFNMQSLMTDLEEAEKLLKLGLGQSFNKEVKKAIIKKKFDRMSDDEIDLMVEEASQSQPTQASTLLNRVPTLNRNANVGGNNGGLQDARGN